MKIEVRKFSSEPKNFSLKLKENDFDIRVNGSICRLSNGLLKIDSKIVGNINLICDRSGEEFVEELNRDIILFAKDGIWNNNHEDSDFDVIEFFDSFIDLTSVFLGEVESIKLEYHIKGE